MEAAVQTSKLCEVGIGQQGAPHRKKLFIGNGELTLTQGGPIHSISVTQSKVESGGSIKTETVTVGNLGPGAKSLTLKDGEYYSKFEANTAYYSPVGQNMVSGVKLTTNLGRVLEVNTNDLPTKSEPGKSIIVDNCFLYAIEAVYGTLVNHITFYYISDFRPSTEV